MCIYFLNILYIVFLCIYLTNKMLLKYTKATKASPMVCPLYICYASTFSGLAIVFFRCW
jgi:hypothetical protein